MTKHTTSDGIGIETRGIEAFRALVNSIIWHDYDVIDPSSCGYIDVEQEILSTDLEELQDEVAPLDHGDMSWMQDFISRDDAGLTRGMCGVFGDAADPRCSLNIQCFNCSKYRDPRKMIPTMREIERADPELARLITHELSRLQE